MVNGFHPSVLLSSIIGLELKGAISACDGKGKFGLLRALAAINNAGNGGAINCAFDVLFLEITPLKFVQIGRAPENQY